jgi:hypothetical protein
MHTSSRFLPLALCMLIACGDDAPPRKGPVILDDDMPADMPVSPDMAPDPPDAPPDEPFDVPPDAWVPDGGLIPEPTSSLRVSPDHVEVVAGETFELELTGQGATFYDSPAIEGAPPGVIASFGQTPDFKLILTLTTPVQLEGTFSFQVSILLDDQRRTAPLLLKVTRAPSLGQIVGGVLMDSQRRPIANKPVHISNLLDARDEVRTDAQGRFTATVVDLPWSLAFPAPAGRSEVDVAALGLSTNKVFITAPRQLTPPDTDSQATLNLNLSPQPDPSRYTLTWVVPRGADARPASLEVAESARDYITRWNQADPDAAIAMAMELERIEGSALPLPRRVAVKEVDLSRGDQAVSLTQLDPISHGLLYLSAPRLISRDTNILEMQVGLCVDEYSRLLLPVQPEGDTATVAIPIYPAAQLTPCATIIRGSDTVRQTVVLGALSPGALYNAPVITNNALYPTPVSNSAQLIWSGVTGSTYVLVGAQTNNARGFAVITESPRVTYAELEALGLQPQGDGSRPLTLNLLLGAPMAELLSAADRRLSWSHYAAQTFTSRRITY